MAIRIRAAMLAGTLAVVSGACGGLGVSGALAATGSASFTTQGCSTWLVPAGVSTVQIQATAGGGAPGTGGNPYETFGAAGDEVSGTLSGISGQTLYVCVAVGGGSGASTNSFQDGDGGGASGVSLGGDFSMPVLVAGGGGGGGAANGAAGGGAGGAPGAPIAQPGGSPTNAPAVTGGGGGDNTDMMGGAAGVNPGQSADDGQMGSGYTAAGPGVGGSNLSGVAGGGGGAGLYGGGSGAGSPNGDGSGGGGTDFCGDSYAGGSSITSCNTSPGVGIHQSPGSGSGDPQVVLTYTPIPTCQPVSTSTPAGQAVTVQLSCTDSAGATLTYAIVSGPSNGTLGMINQSTGQVTYTPNSGYSGPDSFTYDATSSNGTATAQTVSITVVPPPPACQPVSTSTPAGQPVTVQLSCTDSTGATLTYAIVSGPSNGTLGMINQTTGQVVYTPNAGYSGPDSFTYDATSSNGTAMTQTVSITVTPVTPPGADLGVGLSLFPRQVHYRSLLIYTATVTNHGPGAASGVQLRDTLPAGVRSLVITHPAGWSCTTPRVLSSGTITCTSASLASGATARFHFAVVNLEPRGGTLHDTATVSATSTDPNPANNQATITTKVS